MKIFVVSLILVLVSINIVLSEPHLVDFEDLDLGQSPLDYYEDIYFDGRIKVTTGSHIVGINSICTNYTGGVGNSYIIFDYPVQSASFLFKITRIYPTKPVITAHRKDDSIITEWAEGITGEIVECNLYSQNIDIDYIKIYAFDGYWLADSLEWSSPQGAYGYVYDAEDNPVEANILIYSRRTLDSIIGYGISELGEYFIEIDTPGIYIAICIAEGYVNQYKPIIIYDDKPTECSFLLEQE